MNTKRLSNSVLIFLLLIGLLFVIAGCKPPVDPECEHSWKSATCTSPKICTLCQETEGEALGHAWKEATCTESKKCETCGVTEGNPLGHIEVTDAAVSATCTATGLTEGKHCSVCNEVIVAQKVVPALGHTEVIDAAVNATCTEDGLTEGKHCSVCNVVIVAQQTAPALGHTEVTDAAVPATCTATGLTEGKHCSVCNEVLVAQTEIGKLPHTYDDKYDEDCNECGFIRDAECAHKSLTVIPAVAATCTTTGLTEGKVCDKCEEIVVEQKVTSALGHTEVIDAAVPATCTTTGLTEGKHCSVCNEVLVAQQITEMREHNWTYATCTAPKTCDGCGKTEGEALGHSWKNATCTEAKTCRTCKATEGEALGHTWKDATCTEAKTCTVCKATEGRANGHTEVILEAVDADCINSGLTEGKYCSVCDKTLTSQNVVPALGHTEVIDAAVPATCTATGLTEGKHCSECNKVLVAQTEIGKLAHTYDDKYDDSCNECGFIRDAECAHRDVTTLAAKDATCTATGLTEGKVCSKCEEVLLAQEIVPALGHTEVTDAAVPATCTATGLTEGKHCSVCNEVLLAQSTVNALGHNWKNATCTEAKTCNTCGATSGEALGHSISSWISNNDGTHSKKCFNCDYVSDTEDCHGGSPTCAHQAVCEVCNTGYGLPVDHSYTAKLAESRYLASSATCTEKASYYTSCVYCGEIGTETFEYGEANGHKLSVYYTPNNDGTHTRSCTASGCEYSETNNCSGGVTTCTAKAVCQHCAQTYGEDPAHAWNKGEITTQPTCDGAGVKTYTCSACGDTRTEGIAANGHSYTNVVVTEPNCINNGFTTYYCENCDSNYVDKDSYVDALGHDWDQNRTCTTGHSCERCGVTEDELGHNYTLISSTNATCTAAAIDTNKCTNCGDTYEVEVSPATGHNITNVEAEYIHISGCDYRREYKCSKCGECVKYDTVSNHSYSASITTPATCSSEGVKTITCSKCNDSYTESIPVDKTIGHEWVIGEVKDGKRVDTCKCGDKKTVTVYTETNKTDETKAEDLKDSEIELNDASINLGNDVIDSIGSDKNITVSADKLAGEEAGLNEDQLAQVGDNPIYNFTISDGESNISQFGENNYVTITLPYQLEEGEDVDNIAVWFITVDENGDTVLESIKATYNNGYVTFQTNHFSYYTVTRLTPAQRCDLYGHVEARADHVDATCTEDGYTLVRCIRCAKSWKENIEIAGDHELNTVTVAATCTKDGSVTVSCANCDYSTVQKLAAIGHSCTETTIPATCAAEGSTTYTCHCGYTYTVSIPKLQHEYEITVVDPECGKAGYTRHECKHCHYYYDDNYTAPAEHQYICYWVWDSNHNHATPYLKCDCGAEIEGERVNSIKRNKGTTCGKGGTVEYEVSYTFNGITYTHVFSEDGVPTGDHDIDIHKYKNNNSYHWYECKECGAESERAEHVWDNGKITVNPTCSKKGEITYSCTTFGCDRTYKEKIEPTGTHHYQNGECVMCGASQGCDHTLQILTFDFADYGFCGGTMTYESCLCGKNVGSILDATIICEPSEGYEMNETTDENGFPYLSMKGACPDCKMYVEACRYVEVGENCLYSVIMKYDFYDANRNFLVTITDKQSDYQHQYAIVNILEGKNVCQGTYLNVEQCVLCGAYGEPDDASFNGCKLEYVEDSFVTDTEQHESSIGTCSVCGLVVGEKYGAYLEGTCTVIRYGEAYIIFDGEEIYRYTESDVRAYHDMEESYELLGETCQDGVKVYNICTKCGYEGYYHSYGHQYGEQEYIDLGKLGMCSGNSAEKRSCKCCDYTEYINVNTWNCNWRQLGTLEDGGIVYLCSDCNTGKIERKTVTGGTECSSSWTVEYTYLNATTEEVIFTYSTTMFFTNHEYTYEFELMGESCEDGVKVYAVCNKCGNSYNTTNYYHANLEIESYDLSEYGVCGINPTLKIYSCPCGEEGNIEYNWDCNNNYGRYEEYIDENGVYHQVEIIICSSCNIYIELDRYFVQDGCRRYTYCSINIQKDGVTVVSTDYIKDGYHSVHTYEYSFEMLGDSCTDGYRVYYTCTSCGEGNSHISYGHGSYTKEYYDLSQYGVCGNGYIEIRECPCGQSSELNINYYDCDYSIVRDSYVDENGVEHSVSVINCKSCGVTIYRDRYSVIDGCYEYIMEKEIVEMNGEVVVETNYAKYSTFTNHDVDFTYELLGKSCEDGVRMSGVCKNCGYEYDYNYYYHEVHKIADYDFSGYPICNDDSYISVYSCACGREGYINSNIYGCNYTQEQTTYVDGNGITHTLDTYKCVDCGMVSILDTYSEKNGCNRYNYCSYNITIGGETVVDSDYYVNGTTVQHNFEYSYVLNGTNCAEDSVDVTYTCKDCGYSYSTTNWWHVQIPEGEINRVNLGTPCQMEFYYFTCPCGEQKGVHVDGLHGAYNYNQQIIEGGIVQHTTSYYCKDCGMRYTEKWYEVDNGDCTVTTYADIMVIVDGNLLLSKQWDRTEERHNIKTTGQLMEGATNCYEGVIITHTCVDCGLVNSYETYSHDEVEIDSLDVIENGGDCGGRVSIRGCVCGWNSVKVDINNVYCDLWHESTPIFVDNYLSGWYEWFDYSEYFDYDAYMYRCAVTDPEVCGFAVRYAYYWQAEAGECRAYRYCTIQVLNTETNEIFYEKTIKYENEYRTYHSFEYDNNTGIYTCKLCGSYYGNEATTEEHPIYGTLHGNRRFYVDYINGETRNHRSLYDMNNIYHYDYYYYGYSDGSESWDKHEYIYDRDYVAPFGDWWEAYEYIYTTSGGHGYREYTKYTYYLGSHYDLFRRHEENGNWSQSVYEYNYNEKRELINCEYVYTHTDSYGNSFVENGVNHSSNSIGETIKHATCTQPGLVAYCCIVCHEIRDSYEQSPMGHNWVDIIGSDIYACARCGLQGMGGADGDVILEDLTDRFGNGENYVVGYLLYTSIEFEYHVSVVDKEGNIICDLPVEINFVNDEYCGLWISKAQCEAAAAEILPLLGFDGEYDIRVSFVPVDSDGSFDYGITFGDLDSIGDIVISTDTTLDVYVDAGEIVYIPICPEVDSIWHFYSNNYEGNPYATLYDENKNELTWDNNSRDYYNFDITYTLKAGKTYYLGVRWVSAHTVGYINVCLGMDTDLTGHEHTFDYYDVSPTCTSWGYTEYHCYKCGLVERDYNVEPIDHEYNGGYCIWCGTYLEHTCEYVGTEYPPTCYDSGYIHYNCTICNTGYIEYTTPAKGHTWGEEIYTAMPGCDLDGSRYYICVDCYEVKVIEIIPATGHDLSGEQIIQDATCTGEGYVMIYCPNCNCNVITSTLDPLGHDLVDGICTRCLLNVVGGEVSIEGALNTEDGVEVIVTGTIDEIRISYNDNYNNITLYISDGNGHRLCIYRLSGGSDLAVGDVITVTGVISIYGGEREVKNGTYVKVGTHECIEGPFISCTTPITCTLCGKVMSEAFEHSFVDGYCTVCGKDESNGGFTIEDALNTADGVMITVTGTIDEISYSYSEAYDNINLYISDGNGNRLYLYRLNGGADLNVGDVITVTGTMSTYNGQRQVQRGTYEKIGGHDCVEFTQATCTSASYCITCGRILAEALGHEYVDGVCTRCFEDEKYVLDMGMLPTFVKGDKYTGETEMFYYYFTFHYTANSRLESNYKDFDDGFYGSQRYYFGGTTEIYGDGTAKCAISVDLPSAAIVKIWWVAGGDGRQVAVYDGYGNIVSESTENSIKNERYISELYVPESGYYYIGNVLNQNYWYKVEITYIDIDHTHEYEVTNYASSCTEYGYNHYVCNVCGYSYDEITSAPYGHNYGEEFTAVEPGCDFEGYLAHQCSYCGVYEVTSYLPATGHNLNGDSYNVEPTCTSDGHVAEYCTGCNVYVVTEIIKALGHDFVDGVCTRCGETETSVGDMITVYFENNWLWTDVRCYYWPEDGYMWPGVEMTVVGTLDDHDVYAAIIPAGVTGIVFNGIKNDDSGIRDQSPDITTGIMDGAGWKMDWQDRNAVVSIDFVEPEIPTEHVHDEYVDQELVFVKGDENDYYLYLCESCGDWRIHSVVETEEPETPIGHVHDEYVDQELKIHTSETEPKVYFVYLCTGCQEWVFHSAC